MINLTREEAQQVLDALNSCGEDWVADGEWETRVDDYDHELVANALETLRNRLAQPEPKNKPLTHEENKAHNQKILDEFYKENAALYEPEPAKLLLIPALMEQAGWVRKREWQGLTDEEILGEYRQSYGDDGDLTDVYFARAIEAKLKEKNA